jgi:hypothetical protein
MCLKPDIGPCNQADELHRLTRGTNRGLQVAVHKKPLLAVSVEDVLPRVWAGGRTKDKDAWLYESAAASGDLKELSVFQARGYGPGPTSCCGVGRLLSINFSAIGSPVPTHVEGELKGSYKAGAKPIRITGNTSRGS